MLMEHDITFESRAQRWTMTIGDTTDHPVKGARDTKTHSQRLIPVPQELIRLGFVDFLRRVRSSGDKALFPRLTAPNQRAQLGSKWGEWWGRYIRDAGVEVSQPFHAFRHTWTTAARAAGIPKDAREFIQGHAGDGSMNDTYGDLSVLGHHIDKVAYPTLDLLPLHQAGAEERAAKG